MVVDKPEITCANKLYMGERLLFPDILRIVAIFAVLMAHVSSAGFVQFPVSCFYWHVSNFYGCLTRWCIPLFVMISGIFFLNPQRQITLSKLYRKNILRIAVSLVFWGFLYRSIGIVKMIICDKVSITSVLSKMIDEYSKLFFGPVWYHLWFLYMIIGLYILVPVIRVFTENAKKEHYHYLFLVYMLLGSILPLINDSLLFVNSALEINFKITELLGFAFYFVLGFYLYQYEISKRVKKWIYVIAIISFFFQVLGTYFISNWIGVSHSLLYGASRPNVLIQAVAIFLFFKDLSFKRDFSDRTKRVIRSLSKYSFGIYLVHDFFNLFFTKIGFTIVCFNPLFSIPTRTLVSFLLSFLVVWLLDRVPLVRKYCI